MNALENKVPPPAVVLLIGVLMWLVARYGIAALGSTWQIWLGLPFIAAGLACIIPSFRAFQQAKTTINPVTIEATSTLVTSGLFQYSRNPMYLGLALILTGWAFSLGPMLMLLGPLVFVLFIDRFQIAPEERVMSAKFGSAYADYKTRVRRWL